MAYGLVGSGTAGASGVGCALMLTRIFGLDNMSVLLVERGESVGTSFKQWPEEMAFISPSFNQQGGTNSFDLNSIMHGTSPAYSLHAEHPTGEQYATYLGALAQAAELNVRLETEVCGLTPLSQPGEGHLGFEVRLQPAGAPAGFGEKPLRARYVIWAAGEFQFPKSAASLNLKGSELCMHNSTVRSWKALPGDDFVIIGGYESGCDAAVNLAAAGKRTTVIASTPFWDVATPDPSTELAPYTAARLRVATGMHSATPPRLLAPLRATSVEKAAEGGGFVVKAMYAAAAEAPKKSPLRVPCGFSGQSGLQQAGSEIELKTPVPPLNWPDDTKSAVLMEG